MRLLVDRTRQDVWDVIVGDQWRGLVYEQTPTTVYVFDKCGYVRIMGSRAEAERFFRDYYVEKRYGVAPQLPEAQDTACVGCGHRLGTGHAAFVTPRDAGDPVYAHAQCLPGLWAYTDRQTFEHLTAALDWLEYNESHRKRRAGNTPVHHPPEET